MVSKTITDEIGGLSRLKQLEPVMLRGRDKPTEVLEVMEVDGSTRREMRQIVDVPVEYHLAGLADEKACGMARNLSSWGCLLEVSTPLGNGSGLTISFNLRTLGMITVDGVVHHTSKKDSRYYAGVRFLNIRGASRPRIVEWVHQVESEVKGIAEIAA